MQKNLLCWEFRCSGSSVSDVPVAFVPSNNQNTSSTSCNENAHEEIQELTDGKKAAAKKQAHVSTDFPCTRK